MIKGFPFEPSGFFAARTPLLPFDALAQWGAGLRAPAAHAAGASAADLEAALAADRATLIDRLRAIVLDPAVREALFVASPSLDDALEAWLASAGDARAHGVVDVLVRYFARMTARPTPFGLFSGCSVGEVGAATRLELVPRGAYRRHTRLDVHYLSALCDALAKDEELRGRLRYRPSTGIHETTSQLRYAESHADAKTRALTYSLVSVERSGHLDAALARAKEGATRAQIAEAIVGHDAEVELEEAAGFVDSLVDSQLLASDLAPVVTGPEPIDDLVATLRAHGAPAAETLAAAGVAIDAIDAGGTGRLPAQYKDVAKGLEPLPAPAELARLFQVDLYKPAAHSSLGKAVVREIARAVELLTRITPSGEHDALKRFREAFQGRYEGRAVPLLEALDEETGIGFSSGLASSSEPSPLLEGIRFPGDPTPPRVAFGGRERYLQIKIEEAARRGSNEWALTDEDVKALSPRADRAGRASPLPDAFAVMGALHARSGEAADRGEFRVSVNGVSGPSGAVLLGRFCHGDPALRAAVEKHLRAEEARRPDAIFAEVVHLAEGRLGNILCRPLLRGHEIAYLGRSGAPEAQRIHAGDLLVAIERGRVVLRSTRPGDGGKEVVPRLTSAHNTAIAVLGAYRFLAALQYQDGAGVGWSWGALAEAPFLPRVTHGKAVLAPARWVVGGPELKGLAALAPAARFTRVQEIRARHRWPRWVALADGDNVLPFDLDNVLHVDAMATFAKQREWLALVEVLGAGEEDLVATGPEGRFVHELVVPFVRAEARAEQALPAPEAVTLVRRLPPGSEWLYAKLYAGTATADAVLTQIVAPLVAETRASGATHDWFFIRYGDPEWHLRVRFRGDPARLLCEALPRLHALARPWLDDGRVWKLQIDTYEREVERYGGQAGMELSEAVFGADSDAVLAIVERLEPGEGSEARWRLGLRGVHLLLADLGLDLATRAAVMRRMRAGYAAEHHADAAFEIDIGGRFRAERPALEALLEAKVGAEHPLDPGFVALAERSARLAPITEALRVHERAGRLSIAELASSYVHMHVNRILRSEQRTQELVLCDFLARLYESELARAKPKKP